VDFPGASSKITDDEDRQTLQKYSKAYTWPVMYGATLDSAAVLSAFASKADERR